MRRRNVKKTSYRILKLILTFIVINGILILPFIVDITAYADGLSGESETFLDLDGGNLIIPQELYTVSVNGADTTKVKVPDAKIYLYALPKEDIIEETGETTHPISEYPGTSGVTGESGSQYLPGTSDYTNQGYKGNDPDAVFGATGSVIQNVYIPVDEAAYGVGWYRYQLAVGNIGLKECDEQYRPAFFIPDELYIDISNGDPWTEEVGRPRGKVYLDLRKDIHGKVTVSLVVDDQKIEGLERIVTDPTQTGKSLFSPLIANAEESQGYEKDLAVRYQVSNIDFSNQVLGETYTPFQYEGTLRLPSWYTDIDFSEALTGTMTSCSFRKGNLTSLSAESDGSSAKQGIILGTTDPSGGSATFLNFPIGTDYKMEQTTTTLVNQTVTTEVQNTGAPKYKPDPKTDEFIESFVSHIGRVTKEVNDAVNFRNRPEGMAAPPTGVAFHVLPYILMAAAAGVLLLVFLYRIRRGIGDGY